MRHHKLQLIVFVLSSVCTLPALSYEQDTHKELTTAAVKNTILNTSTGNILADLGLSTDIGLITKSQQFPNSVGEQKTIIQLIEDGADFEDNGIRSVQHFYDPVNDRSLQHPLLTIAGGTNKSPDWAIEDIGAISAQEYSYADAVEVFYQALTLPTKSERDGKWGKLFETLGHVIHHVQDMAQPEHVRNDLHCGEVIPCGIPGAVLGLYDQSLFERRSLKVFEDGVPEELINYPAVSFPTAREFWTTRDTDGSVTARRGLADFTNRNFVSKDTNFELISGAVSANSKYSLPVPIVDPTNKYSLSQLLPSEGADICQTLNQNSPIDLPANAPCEIEFIKSTVTDSYVPAQGGINPKAASLSLFDQYLTKYNVSSVQVGDGDAVHMVDVDRLVTINRFNIDESHKFLIPRAVAYGAGLIDHFFRGKIDMVPDPNGEGWVIKNLSDEEMEGTFTLYYDHVDPVDGVEKRDSIPGATWYLTIAANSEAIVGNYNVPVGFIRKALVFNGRIGEENNVIAGKVGGGWSAPVAIGATSTSWGNLAMDAGGNAMVVYPTRDYATKTYSLWSQHYTPGGGWGDDMLIANYNSGSNGSFDSSLAMDAGGNAMVVYDTYDSTSRTWNLWTRRYTPEGGWGGDMLIATNNNDFDHQYYPQFNYVYLAMNDDGNAMVVYRTYDDTSETWRLWSRRYTPGGGWGGNTLITSSNDVNDYGSLAMDAGGNAMVVYSTYGFTNQTWGLWSQRYTPGGGWGVAMPITNSSNSSNAVNNGSLAMDAGGNALVVYRAYDDTSETWKLWSRRYTPNGGWGSDMLITTNILSHNTIGSLAMDAGGNAFVIYRNATGSVVVKQSVPGIGWDYEVQLSVLDQSPVSGAAWSIDMETNGKAVVVWRDWSGNLWSNFYTP